MPVLLTPPSLQFFDNNGIPLANGLLYTYIAGTTTPKATYTDETGDTLAPNPVVLDAAGRATIWILGSYKFILKDSVGNTITTTDNVTSFTTAESGSPSYFQSFSGNGATTAFTLSQSLGTDSNSIMVFISDSSVYPFFQNFSGTGSQTVFTLSSAQGANSNSLIVTVAGVVQNPSTYTVSGTTLTFTSAPASGTNNIQVRNFLNAGYEIQNPSTYTLNGTSLSFSVAPVTGTNNIYVFAPSLLLGTAATYADAAQASANVATAASASATASATTASAAVVTTNANVTTTNNNVTTTNNNVTTTNNNVTTTNTNATAAAASASAAATSAIQAASTFTSTSTTSNTIGTGSLTFTTQANKGYVATQFIEAANDSSHYVAGTITSYNNTTGVLVMNATNTLGSGTFSSWTLSVSGAPGINGTGTGTVTSVTFTGDGTVLSSTPSSAVTVSGTVTAALNTQTANKVLAGPASGGAVAPTFRSLVTADFPTTGVSAASYTAANITVDATGRITAASNGSAGELVLLGTATASASATLDFTSMISSSYSHYILAINNLLLSATASIGLKVSGDNGSTWTTVLGSQLQAIQIGSSAASSNTNVNGATPAIISQSLQAAFNGEARFVVTGTNAGIMWEGTTNVIGSSEWPIYKSYVNASAAVTVNAIRLLPSSGNFTSGVVYLYGVKNT